MVFQFRFESIVRQRLAERDQASLALTETQRQIDQVDAQTTQLQQQRQQLHSNRVRTGRISIASLQSADEHDAYLLSESEKLQQQRIVLVATLSELQTDLLSAQQEVKKLQKLRESERAAWLADQRSREQQHADDQSNAARYLANRPQASARNVAS